LCQEFPATSPALSVAIGMIWMGWIGTAGPDDPDRMAWSRHAIDAMPLMHAYAMMC